MGYRGQRDSISLNREGVPPGGYPQSCSLCGLSSARTKAGGLYSVDLDYLDNGAQSAELAVKLLNGELDPRMGPAVSGKLVYFLNLTTAGRVHVKLTDDVIGGAREVFRAEEQGCAGK